MLIHSLVLHLLSTRGSVLAPVLPKLETSLRTKIYVKRPWSPAPKPFMRRYDDFLQDEGFLGQIF